jgi:DNA-binding MarR family transcriptional regulator
MGHPVRYSIMALLYAADRAEFGFVRDHVEVSDSVLSKQMTALQEAGYVKVHKGYVENRPRTWLSLTRLGRQKFERHLAALREIAGGNGISVAS